MLSIALSIPISIENSFLIPIPAAAIKVRIALWIGSGSYARKVSRNHTQTCWVLKRYIEDTDAVWLLSEIIDSFQTSNSIGVGLPLGNLTSQLLVNIYMNEFDQFLKRELKVRHYIRYADDFVILHEDKKYLEDLLPQISLFLAARLKLSLHPDKVFIKTFASGVDFLGWIHFPHHRVLRTATKWRIIRNLEQNFSDAIVASYKGILKHGNAYELQKKIML
jgi:RNA-directed DNA polymerase